MSDPFPRVPVPVPSSAGAPMLKTGSGGSTGAGMLRSVSCCGAAGRRARPGCRRPPKSRASYVSRVDRGARRRRCAPLHPHVRAASAPCAFQLRDKLQEYKTENETLGRLASQLHKERDALAARLAQLQDAEAAAAADAVAARRAAEAADIESRRLLTRLERLGAAADEGKQQLERCVDPVPGRCAWLWGCCRARAHPADRLIGLLEPSLEQASKS